MKQILKITTFALCAAMLSMCCFAQSSKKNVGAVSPAQGTITRKSACAYCGGEVYAGKHCEAKSYTGLCVSLSKILEDRKEERKQNVIDRKIKAVTNSVVSRFYKEDIKLLDKAIAGGKSGDPHFWAKEEKRDIMYTAEEEALIILEKKGNDESKISAALNEIDKIYQNLKDNKYKTAFENISDDGLRELKRKVRLEAAQQYAK